jgi:hypothetical protein
MNKILLGVLLMVCVQIGFGGYSVVLAVYGKGHINPFVCLSNFVDGGISQRGPPHSQTKRSPVVPVHGHHRHLWQSSHVHHWSVQCGSGHRVDFSTLNPRVYRHRGPGCSTRDGAVAVWTWTNTTKQPRPTQLRRGWSDGLVGVVQSNWYSVGVCWGLCHGPVGSEKEHGGGGPFGIDG